MKPVSGGDSTGAVCASNDRDCSAEGTRGLRDSEGFRGMDGAGDWVFGRSNSVAGVA
ncbi:MAG: hypothetical protein V7L09_28820 [Nostoc sp.]|uniref:hypothetical protein n=1 Tax=Nostoc sp. TaxID=1180 RepID=UPI002FEF45A0